jgi:hypothetical protein
MDLVTTGHPILIQKASGEQEPFDVNKLKASLHKAGARDDIIAEIVADIEAWVYPGVSTGKIYTRAYKLYKQKNGFGALRYKLKMAMFGMGPSGHPFEQFVGELFRRQDYHVEVAQVLQGAAITHEMDVIATKDKVQNLMECKYSHDQGKHVSIQVPLYVYSRVNDIIEKRRQDSSFNDISFVPWVVTNTRFSGDSIAYSLSKGINLLGWDYPRDNSLKNLIERERLYPITILTHLGKQDLQLLMAEGIVTCAQLQRQTHKLEQLGISHNKQRSVMRELESLAEV